MRPRRSSLLFLVTGLGLCGAAIIWWLLLPSPPEPPVPGNLDAADPEVQQLIAESLALVRRQRRQGSAWVQLAVGFDANGFLEEASECYRVALSLDDSQPKWWYWLALLRDRLGDTDGAIAAVQRVTSLDREYAPAHARLGQWLLARGDTAAAISAFEAASSIDPTYPAGTLGLARSHITRDVPTRAVDLLRTHLRRYPRDGYAHHLLGIALRQSGERPAETAFAPRVKDTSFWDDPWRDEVLQFRRGYAAMVKMAVASASLGQHREVIALLSWLRQRHPNDALLLNNLGASYAAIGDYQNALATLLSAMDQDPGQFATHLNLALAYVGMRRWTQARIQAERTLELNPEAAGAYRALGFIAMNTGDPSSAMQAFSTALEYDPQNIDARVQLGLLQCHVQECGLGISNLELAARQDPTNPGTFLAIARAKGEAGLLEAASAAFDRAAILDPHHPNLNVVRGYLSELTNAGSESAGNDGDR